MPRKKVQKMHLLSWMSVYYSALLCKCCVCASFILINLFSDKPSVSIERHTSSELEDGRGSLTLTCLSQSNPPGRTLWYKKGDTSSSAQYKDQLVFDPISKQQAGDYVCQEEIKHMSALSNDRKKC